MISVLEPKGKLLENSTVETSDIFWTDEYDAFKFYDLNRDIDNNYVSNKIKKSLLEQGWLPQFPMVVDEDFNIMDGQHRFLAAKELKIKIPVKIAQGFTDEQMIAINNATKRWSDKDFIAYKAKKGDVAARKLVTLCNRYNFTARSAMRVVGIYTRTSLKESILNDFDFNRAEKIAQQIIEILEILKEKGTKSIEALATFTKHPDYDHERFINKLSSQQDRIHHCNTIGAFIEMFENIYNYNSRNKIRVRG